MVLSVRGHISKLLLLPKKSIQRTRTPARINKIQVLTIQKIPAIPSLLCESRGRVSKRKAPLEIPQMEVKRIIIFWINTNKLNPRKKVGAALSSDTFKDNRHIIKGLLKMLYNNILKQ